MSEAAELARLAAINSGNPTGGSGTATPNMETVSVGGGTTVKMAINPPLLDEFDCYDEYEACILMWSECCGIPKNNQGPVLSLTIPNESKKFGDKIRKNLFHAVLPNTLPNNPDGVKNILAYLRKKLGKEQRISELDTFYEIWRFARKPGQSIQEYISDFETLQHKCAAMDLIFPDNILAFILLCSADLSDLELKLIKSVINIQENRGVLYDKLKNKLVEMLTNSLGNVVNRDKISEPNNTFVVQDQFDVLVANGWQPPPKRGKDRRKTMLPTENKSGHRQNSYYRTNKPQERRYENTNRRPENRGNTTSNTSRHTNPIGYDGKPMQCLACESILHMIRDCPHAYENKKRDSRRSNQRHQGPRYKEKLFLVECNTDEESQTSQDSEDELDLQEIQEGAAKICMFTNNNEEISKFTTECINSGTLDTCCSSSVCGEKWLKVFFDTIPHDMRQKVIGPNKSDKQFMFGNQGIMTADEKYILPVIIAGKEDTIEVDVIQSDIPLLIANKDMKRMGMVIDMKNDQGTIDGRPLQLYSVTGGHYKIDLIHKNDEISHEEVFAVNLMELDQSEQKKALDKLHKQFGHKQKQAYINLLKQAGKWIDDFSPMLDQIIDGCEGCIRQKRSPDRPAVAMPMGNDFNEVVTMDIKIWKGKNILYLIDSFTRYTIATVIPSKHPDVVVDAILKQWIKIFGIMGEIHHDNGGEFSSHLMRDVTSILNVKDHSTGAESPWQNGLCERNHALVDNILTGVIRDYPKLDLEVALAWACTAKNSMTNVYGYSPNQLVFGRSIRLPNIIDDPPPTWEVKSKSKALMDHLEILHATRVEFTKAERSERLRKALHSKIRTASTVYDNGDWVYYRRDSEDRWYGPGKVVFQDNKVIFVRHGSTYVRVSANRLMKAKPELVQKIELQQKEVEVKQALTNDNNKQARTTQEIYLYEQDTYQVNNDTHSTARDDNDTLTVQQDEDNLVSDATETVDTMEHLPNSSQSTEQIAEPINNPPSPIQTTATEPAVPVKLKNGQRIELKENGKWESGIIIKRAGKATGKYPNFWNIKLDDGRIMDRDCLSNIVRKPTPERVLATWAHAEVLAVLLPKEKRSTPECEEAKQTELDKLREFNTYDIIEDQGQPYITTTWVLTEKQDQIRARLTARGYEEVGDFPKDSPTMQKASLRIVLALATASNWQVETTDIKSAFLQGSPLDREVLVRPPKEANLKGYLWKLKKCLYGLKDASRNWYLKVKKKLEELGFNKSRYDRGLFFIIKNDKLIGILGMHVDDFLHAGNKEFNQVILPQVLSAFKVGKSESRTFLYTGFQINQDDKGITLDQTNFVDNINIPTLDATRLLSKNSEMTQEELTLLRRMTGVLNWVVRATRPDLSFNMIKLSTNFKGGEVEDLDKAQKTLVNLKKNPAYIRISDVGDLSKAELWCFSDAAHKNLNNNKDDAAGYIIFLVNPDNGACAPLDWRANKIKRRAHSTLAAETLALYSALDATIAIKRTIRDITNGKVNLKIKGITDNKSARDAVYSTTDVEEKRLRGDISDIQEMTETGDVNEIRWVRGEIMLADALTKKGVNSLQLMQVMQEGRLTREQLDVYN